MSDAPSYAAPVAVGDVMEGGTVKQVVTSHVVGFSAGDRMLCFNGWQDYALPDGVGVTLLDAGMAHPSWALGILGMPGFTAWAGLTQIGVLRFAYSASSCARSAGLRKRQMSSRRMPRQ